MIFILLVLLAALCIEGIGTYMSVIGLAALFAANPIIIVMAIALDVGKVVSVSFLYRNWKKINWIMKSYMTTAAMVLILITSTGVFGYLSGEFQKAIQGTSENGVLVQSMEDEKTRLQFRKTEIDAQIAAIPPDFTKGRRQAIKAFAEESTRINDRLVTIDAELPKLKVEAIKKGVEVGPVIYVANAFDTTPEIAVKYIIFTIIFVFDPLAIALLIAGNFLIAERQKAKVVSSEEPSLPLNAVIEKDLPEVEDTDSRVYGPQADFPDEAEHEENAEAWHEHFGGAIAEIDDEPEIQVPVQEDKGNVPLPEEIASQEVRDIITRDRLLRYPIKSAFDGIGNKSDVYEDDGNVSHQSASASIYRAP